MVKEAINKVKILKFEINSYDLKIEQISHKFVSTIQDSFKQILSSTKP